MIKPMSANIFTKFYQNVNKFFNKISKIYRAVRRYYQIKIFTNTLIDLFLLYICVLYKQRNLNIIEKERQLCLLYTAYYTILYLCFAVCVLYIKRKDTLIILYCMLYHTLPMLCLRVITQRKAYARP